MENIKVIATNKKAFHEYFIEEKYEAGIVLVGSEVKSVRMSKINFKDSYIDIRKGEAYIVGMHISPYEKGSYYNSEAERDRKLLLQKREINKLFGQVTQKGYTIVPLRVYFKGSLVKVEIALAKGKELHDKRRAIAEREVKRDVERELARYK